MAGKPVQIRHKTGIRSRVLLPTVFVLILQIVLLFGGILASGILSTLEDNAMDVMQSRTDARRDYLQYNMLNRWSDVEPFLDGIGENMEAFTAERGVTVAEVCTNTALADAFLAESSDVLVSTMRRNAVTGAFVMLCTDEAPALGDALPGLYIRDRDPVSAYTSANRDLLLERAPVGVVSALDISTDSDWKPLFTPTSEEVFSALFRTYFEAQAHPDMEPISLAYWSWTRLLEEDRAGSLSYSVPLKSADGTLYGILGIEILADYLTQELPYSEIGNGQGTYVIAATEGTNGYHAICVNSSDALLDTREVEKIEPHSADSDFQHVIFSDDTLLAMCSSQLSLYDHASLYAEQNWQLYALQPEAELFSVLRSTFMSFAMVLTVSTLVTLLMALFIVHSITHPVMALEREVRAADSSRPVRFTSTKIRELDTLSEAVYTLNREVVRSAGKLSRFLEMSSVNLGAFEFDRDSHRVFANRTFFAVYGEVDIDCTHLSYDEFYTKLKGYEPFVIPDSIITSEGFHRCTYEIPAERGTIWVRLQVEEGEHYVSGFAEDVTIEYRERRKLEYQRDRDALTGILNRRAFYSRYYELFQHTEALKFAALLMLDLDNLKHINDTYGHEYGDAYICAAADALTDHAGARPGAIAARVSGDEFLLFLSGYEEKNDLEAEIARVRVSLMERNVPLPGGDSFPMRVSAGITYYPEDSVAPDQLIRFADFAMYAGKHSGKGQFKHFSAEQYEQEAFLLQGSEALNRLIEQRNLDYHFQPIVDINTGEVFGYEALMRPNVPGLERPLDVLRLARQELRLGEIEKLTWFCAMRAFVRHCRAGLVGENCKVFINSISNQAMSTAEIEQFEEEFRPWLSRVVQEHTEEEQSVAEFSTRKALRMHKWGGGVAIDDFGSGYSSELILLSINPDYVKADGSIVRDIDTSPNKQARIRALVQYASPRGISVIGEGVETYEELATLRALGVRYVQGYYLGRPSPTPQKVDPQVLRGPDGILPDSRV